MQWIDHLQWPAMVVTLLASWLVASQSPGRRNAGFWVFIASNVLWIGWGVFSQAWALVLLQFGLAALNIRGTLKTAKAESQSAQHEPPADAPA